MTRLLLVVLSLTLLSLSHAVNVKLRGLDFDTDINPLDPGAASMHLTSAPPLVNPPLSVAAHAPRFKAQATEVVKALNALDLRTMTNASDPLPRAEYPRAVVAAYGTLAAETVQRANYALAMLRTQKEGLESFLKVQRHDMMLWVAQQKKVAQAQIGQQIQAIGRLEDEISHLQRVYQDAVGKERSYDVQKSMLIAERQLQHTPPVMPVEVAVALTDAQYKEALAKLNQYIAAAREVITQTHAHIQSRKKMAEQLNDWVKKSNTTLTEWLKLQGGLIGRRVGETTQALNVNAERIKAVMKMSTDATASFKEYSNAVQRLDIKGRIAELNAAKKKWTETKPKTPYDEATIKSYVVALDLEIKAFEKRLTASPGDDKVTPPPQVWGVLAGFPSGPKVLFPEPVKTKLHPWVPPRNTVWLHPAGFKAPIPPPTDPSIRFHVPTAEEHEGLSTWVSPTLPADLGMGVTAGTDAFGRHTWFPGALAAVHTDPAMTNAALGAASAVSAAPAAEPKGDGNLLPFGVPVPFGGPIAPIALPGLPSFVEQQSTVTPRMAQRANVPQMPNLPPPPEADLVM